MLKFVKHHMTSIAGIEIYPILSFLIFFIFFLVVVIRVARSNKGFIEQMSNLPLEDSVKEIEKINL